MLFRSDVTYRLFDWNRTAADGRPRPLHVEAGLEAVTHFGPVAPRTAAKTGAASRRLVTCDYFLFDEVRPTGDWSVGGDDGCHFLAVLSGEIRLDPRYRLPPLSRGMCVLLPAAIGTQTLSPAAGSEPVTMLHVSLP